MPDLPAAVTDLGGRLESLGWVTSLLVAGSLATGDYVPGVSDIDLVAIVDGPVDPPRSTTLTGVHRHLDESIAAGLDLGCVYVDGRQLPVIAAQHPTWTHGVLLQRILSGITRAELVQHGFAVFGPAPRAVLPPMDADDVREAARAEVLGYWAQASRRPWMWCDPILADLSLTSMARGRHALATGHLLTKTAAIEQADAPPGRRRELASRRRGEPVTSPRLRTAVTAWRDARRTVALARSLRRVGLAEAGPEHVSLDDSITNAHPADDDGG